MSITLPPLPIRPWRMFCTKCGRTTPLDAKDVQHSPPGSPFVSHFGVCPCGYQALAEQAPWTADQLRARDLEIVRLVLEAAAKECEKRERVIGELHADQKPGTEAFWMVQGVMSASLRNAEHIRAMEVRHHE